MKKIISIIAIIATATIVLMACGSKPETMTQDTYENGKRALEVMEKYIDFQIDKDEAEGRLYSIKEALDEERKGIDDVLQNTDNLLVSTSIHHFILAMDGISSVSIYDEAETLRGYLKP